MIAKLVDYLNHPILVSIPSLHSDRSCRSYTLRGVEMQGLWLQGEWLKDQVVAAETTRLVEPSAIAFVPFSHIACVLLPPPYEKAAGLSIEQRHELMHAKPVPLQPGHEPHTKREPQAERHARKAEPKRKPKK